MEDATPGPCRLPYRLGWDLEPAARPGHRRATKPGRGDAGWTVATFASVDAALTFMDAHPEAEMPCWRRFRPVA